MGSKYGRRYTKPKLRQMIIEMYEQLGRPPTENHLVERSEWPSPTTFERRWESFAEIRDEVLSGYDEGYEPPEEPEWLSDGPVYSDEDLLMWIVAWFREFGVEPKAQDFYAEDSPTPHPATYSNRFGKSFSDVRDEVVERLQK